MPDIINAAFPIVTYMPQKNTWKCMGTGYFIHPLGGFVTAKHVFVDIDNKYLETLYAVQTTSSGERHLRTLKHLSAHSSADICVGMLGNRRLSDGKNAKAEETAHFSLRYRRISDGASIRSFAFPQTETTILGDGKYEFTFSGQWTSGNIECFCEEGSPVVRNPCYQTTMKIDHGASGGPVIDKEGIIIGVNSSGMDLMGGETPLSFVTPIDLISELQVPSESSHISIRELGEKGYISIRQ